MMSVYGHATCVKLNLKLQTAVNGLSQFYCLVLGLHDATEWEDPQYDRVRHSSVSRYATFLLFTVMFFLICATISFAFAALTDCTQETGDKSRAL